MHPYWTNILGSLSICCKGASRVWVLIIRSQDDCILSDPLVLLRSLLRSPVLSPATVISVRYCSRREEPPPPRGHALPPPPPWVVGHRGYKAWFSCFHLGRHRRATPDPVLSVGWLRPRWRPHRRPASPLPKSSFLATHHLTGVSPESILSKPCAHDCLPQCHVQVSPGTGRLVKQYSSMTLEGHEVIFWPYFQVLGYFSLTEVGKKSVERTDKSGWKSSPHLDKHRPLPESASRPQRGVGNSQAVVPWRR